MVALLAAVPLLTLGNNCSNIRIIDVEITRLVTLCPTDGNKYVPRPQQFFYFHFEFIFFVNYKLKTE